MSALYNQYTKQVDSFISTKLFGVQDGFTDACLKGFVGSCAISAIFASKNQLGAGIRAGTLSVLATTVDALVRGSLTKILEGSKIKLKPEHYSDILKGSFVAVAFASYKMGLKVNLPVSTGISLAWYVYNYCNRDKNPIFGFVAHG